MRETRALLRIDVNSGHATRVFAFLVCETSSPCVSLFPLSLSLLFAEPLICFSIHEVVGTLVVEAQSAILGTHCVRDTVVALRRN